MSRMPGPTLAALAVAALLFGLSLVAWRQSRALEALAELDRVSKELAVARAERTDLERRIQYLEGRGRVVREARDRLGMRRPAADEIVYLSGEVP